MLGQIDVKQVGALLTFGWLVSCHSNGGATQSAHEQASIDAESTQAFGSNASTTSANASSTLSMPNCPAPDTKGVRLVGRYDGCKPAGPRASWSGSGFVARFTGTGLSATIEGGELIFTVVVDGVVGPDLLTESGKSTYPLATGLSPAEHTIELYRQGEASFGPSVLHAVTAIDGDLLAPPAGATRRIEIVGDSITAGYGNEGTSTSCSFSAETENHYLTYGAILARELQADLSTVAWSGKGVVSNYGGNRELPMPQLYARAEPGDNKSAWDFSLWQPHAVIMNLSTNDYSTDNDPTDTEFTDAYEQLLTVIRGRYPEAQIICTVGPLLGGIDLEKAEANIANAVKRREVAGDSAVRFHAMRVENTEPGCDWHPSLGTHRVMADALKPVVAAALGW